MFFGAVGVFMGGVVTINAFARGAITYTFQDGAGLVTRTATMAAEPEIFWQRLAIIGVLPIVVGLIGLWWGRRQFAGGRTTRP